MTWSRPFDDPIPLPGPGALRTLREAGEYIAGLSKAQQQLPHWQAAAEALILVAERGGPTMFARIGIMRALNRGKPPPEIEPRRKARVFTVIRESENRL